MIVWRGLAGENNGLCLALATRLGTRSDAGEDNYKVLYMPVIADTPSAKPHKTRRRL